MALMSKPTDDPKVSRWWWRPLRTWVYGLVDPLWAAFRGENSDDIALSNVTSINGISSAEFGLLDGLTATTAELNLLAGLTATAAELNKTDRTQADGIAEASKVTVLDANKDISGKRFDINQSLLAVITGKPYFHFDGNSYVVDPDAGANLGDLGKDFTVFIECKTPSISGGFMALAYQFAGDSTSLSFRINRPSSNTDALAIGFYDTDGATLREAVADGIVAPDKIIFFAGTYDGADLKAYVNGVLMDTLATTGTPAFDANNRLVLGGRYTGSYGALWDGDLYKALIFNRALSQDEIGSLTSGAPLAFTDVGASQADKVTNGDDWTGATGSTPPNSWSDSGSASVTYIIRDNTGVANMDDKVLEIDVSGSGSKTLAQGVFQTGKRYRVTFAYRNLDGSGGATKVTFGSSGNSATLQNTTIAGDGVIFTQEVLADGADLAFEVTTAGALQIDAVQVVQIGCVAAFRPEGINAVQWQDAGGNEFHGQVNGAVPLNLPSNHLAGYVKKGITADTTLTGVVPAGYRIRSIIVEETAGNAITGGLKIGASAGGTEVVNAQAVGAGALVDCALGTRLFSLTATQTLYVADVTAWNSASIDLYLEMERIK